MIECKKELVRLLRVESLTHEQIKSILNLLSKEDIEDCKNEFNIWDKDFKKALS